MSLGKFVFDSLVKYDKIKTVKYMNTRMDKYKDNDGEVQSRTIRNKNIYTELSEKDLDDINLTSNISVLNADSKNLDIDTLKKMLDEKYQKDRPNSVQSNEEIESEEVKEDEDTKEYDLKKIIETAHKNKTTSYDTERFKKLRETQYDILNSLNIEKNEPIKNVDESLTVEEANLMNLIKTVNENAEKNKSLPEDDLFQDLKGDEKTEVLEPLNFGEDEEEPEKKPTIVEELEKTKQLSRKEIDDEIEKLTSKLDDVIEAVKEVVNEEEERPTEPEISKTEELSNSFYTGKFQISNKDMDDFSDLEREMNGGSIFVKILIILLVLIIIAVTIYLLNKYLGLGLF